MILLAPSMLAADFKKLKEEVEAVEQAGAHYLHIDVMDGMFVPSISFGMPVIKSLRSCTELFFDVHMMVEEPGRYVISMKEAGADLICVHQEACTHLDRTVSQIKELDIQAGVALNPATPISVLDCILPQLDLVLVMSVNPGFGGQTFLPYTLDKIRGLRKSIETLGLSTRIQVDGGIGLDNVAQVVEAGADVIVAGSAIFGKNPALQVGKFLTKFGEMQS